MKNRNFIAPLISIIFILIGSSAYAIATFEITVNAVIPSYCVLSLPDGNTLTIASINKGNKNSRVVSNSLDATIYCSINGAQNSNMNVTFDPHNGKGSGSLANYGKLCETSSGDCSTFLPYTLNLKPCGEGVAQTLDPNQATQFAAASQSECTTEIGKIEAIYPGDQVPSEFEPVAGHYTDTATVTVTPP